MTNAIFDPVLVKRKTQFSQARSGERAQQLVPRSLARKSASRRWVPALAEPIIHSLPRAVATVAQD